MLVLLVRVVALNGITVAKASNTSPLDEEMWIDHLIHGSELQIAHSGDHLSEESIYELCVRAGPTLGEVHPPCDERPLRPADFRWHGVNLAGHTSFYFLITGPVARVLRATPIDLPPSDSLATWARLLGSAWLLLGWYLVLRIGDLLRVHRRRLVVALVLLSATPALLQASTTVNPDQTAVPAGAAVLLAILAWERRGRGILSVTLAAAAGVALDPTRRVAVVGTDGPPFNDALGSYTPRSTGAHLFFVEVATFLSIGAMLVVALRNRFAERTASLDFALVLALLASPLLFVLRNYWVGGGFGPTFARFGLAAIPTLAIVIAGAGRNQVSRAAILVVAAGLYVTALLAVL